jgi:hypothetical protein
MADRTDDEAVRARQDAMDAIELVKETEKALTNFHHELSVEWATADRRVLPFAIVDITLNEDILVL